MEYYDKKNLIEEINNQKKSNDKREINLQKKYIKKIIIEEISKIKIHIFIYKKIDKYKKGNMYG